MSKYPPLDFQDNLPFGKYKGLTCGAVADADPGYLFWLMNNTDVRFVQGLEQYIEDNRHDSEGDDFAFDDERDYPW